VRADLGQVVTDDLFDQGAAIFAMSLHIEKQLSGAAAWGDAERQIAPATLGLHEEYILGVGFVAVAETPFQKWHLEGVQKEGTT
jgi:hypothetical protein